MLATDGGRAGRVWLLVSARALYKCPGRYPRTGLVPPSLATRERWRSVPTCGVAYRGAVEQRVRTGQRDQGQQTAVGGAAAAAGGYALQQPIQQLATCKNDIIRHTWKTTYGSCLPGGQSKGRSE